VDTQQATGLRLRDERLRLGMTQAQLGAIASVTVQSQSLYEKGKNRLTNDYLAAIAAAGVDVLYVLTGKRVVSPSAVESDLPLDEQQLLSAYREVNEDGRKALRTICTALSKANP